MTIGEYTLTIPPGTYNVTASKDGYISQHLTAEVAADMITVANFQLSEEEILTGTLSGTVTDKETGIYISDVKITADGYSTSTE